ncbi:MAG: DUF3108 domain-containing protein [Deltaproteobacteria bacterium]|nr:DUF3108 domain-containing protein [Deltaproteobacteria bacterium]
MRPCNHATFRFLSVFMLAALAAAPFAARGAAPALPSAGEKYVYNIRWSIFPAGRVVLQTLPSETIDGEVAHHFRMTAETNSLVDAFYKVRDRVDSWVDKDMTRSLRYEKSQHEGSTHREVLVTFDWDKNQAEYVQNGISEGTVEIMEGCFDPLAVLHYFRFMELSPGAVFEAPVTDGKKAVMGRAKVVKKEKISIPLGDLSAWLVEPELTHVGGVFEKDEKASLQIWFAAEGPRVPVRIKSKVAVGSFVAELAEVQKGTAPRTTQRESVEEYLP